MEINLSNKNLGNLPNVLVGILLICIFSLPAYSTEPFSFKSTTAASSSKPYCPASAITSILPLGSDSVLDADSTGIGILQLYLSNSPTFLVVGTRLDLLHSLYITHEVYQSGAVCLSSVKAPLIQVSISSLTDSHARIDLSSATQHYNLGGYDYYLCAAWNTSGSGSEDAYPPRIFQGNSSYLRFHVNNRRTFLPLWLQIVLVVFFLTMSAIFSGLNLGLMSLDMTELEIFIKSGSEAEKRYARMIKPLRKRGNFLLCTILLGNVFVNTTLTLFLDQIIGTGVLVALASTLAIVIFGEITPQAVCSRYGLAVGGYTFWIMWIVMVITFPLSFPISKVLDWILGAEAGPVYNRAKLRELIRLAHRAGPENTDIGDERLILEGFASYDSILLN